MLAVTFTDSAAPRTRGGSLVFACGRFGALALARDHAAILGTCGVPEETRAGSSLAPGDPPTRQVCVEDPAAPNGLRLSDAVVQRLPGDSALDRGGERRPLSELGPRVVGYVAGPDGLEPPGMDARHGATPGTSRLFGTGFSRYGVPRTLRPGSPHWPIRIGEAMGASIFVPPGLDVREMPGLVYVLLPDCRFQGYTPGEYLV